MKEEVKVENKSGKSFILISLIVALIFGVGGFYGGMQYEKSKIRSFNFDSGERQNMGSIRPNGQANRQGGFVPISGEIISKDDKSITVKTEDGGTKIILISDTTAVNRAEKKTKDDLKEGEKVSVVGTTNSDGSVTARNISLGEFFRLGNGGNGN